MQGGKQADRVTLLGQPAKQDYALDISLGVPPVSRSGSGGPDRLIALLPDSQSGDRHARHARDGAAAEDWLAGMRCRSIPLIFLERRHYLPNELKMSFLLIGKEGLKLV